jgi:hypothetical protein
MKISIGRDAAIERLKQMLAATDCDSELDDDVLTQEYVAALTMAINALSGRVIPKCRECKFCERIAGTGKYARCKHLEYDDHVCVLTLPKTSPRWCPLRNPKKERKVQE